MKNLPDDELFDRVKVRLQNFQEAPDDDVWTGIESAISKPPSVQSRNRFALILALMLLGLGRGYLMQTSDADTAATSSPLDQVLSEADSDSPVVDQDGDEQPGAETHITIEGNESLRSSEIQSHETKSSDGGVDQTRTIKQHDNQKVNGVHNANNVANDPALVGRPVNKSRQVKIDSPTGKNAISEGNTDSVVSVSANTSQAPIALADSLKDRTIPSDSVQAKVIIAKHDSTAREEVIASVKARKHESPWRIYGMATPSLTFQHVNPSANDDVTFDKLNSPGVLSGERLSFSFEAGAQFLVARRLNVFAGLSYYQQSAELSLDQIVPGTSNISSQGGFDYNVEPNTITTTIDYRMKNIGAIAGATYVISVGKLVHQLGGALQYEYGMINSSTETDRHSSRNFVNFRIFYRAEYGLNDRMSVFVQPLFSRSLLSDEVLNGALRVKQSRAGIGFGILYRFK